MQISILHNTEISFMANHKVALVRQAQDNYVSDPINCSLSINPEFTSD